MDSIRFFAVYKGIYELEVIDYLFYGKLGDIYLKHNESTIPIPSGGYTPIYRGHFLEPTEIEFEIFEPANQDIFRKLAGRYYWYRVDIDLERYPESGGNFNLYNIEISETLFCKIYKGTTELPAGNYRLFRGKFTVRAT